jgi:hypothetical protein
MGLSTLANIITALAILVGVVFAATQIRAYRKQRRRDAMLRLVQSFQNPPFVKGLRRIIELPDGASAQKIREILGPEGEDVVAHVTATWETLGVLLFHNEVTLDIVDDFFSGPILISWWKLLPYVTDLRERYQRDTWSEYFQWMAERMMERESRTPVVPAYRAHAPGAKSYKSWARGDCALCARSTT